MRRTTFFALLATLAIAVPAAGYKPPKPPKPPKQHKQHKPHKPHGPKPPKPPKEHKPHKPKPPRPPKPPKPCVAHTVGYNATGTLVKSGTKLTHHKHRFRGTLEVVIKKANPHAGLGDHKFGVVHVQVTLRHGLRASSLATGDRVVLHGKVTALPARCSSAGFVPRITLKKVVIGPPAKKKHHGG
jgi:hypothetical protein